MGYAVQVSHEVSVVIWDRELGGDGGNDESTKWIPSFGINKDYRDDRATYNKK